MKRSLSSSKLQAMTTHFKFSQSTLKRVTKTTAPHKDHIVVWKLPLKNNSNSPTTSYQCEEVSSKKTEVVSKETQSSPRNFYPSIQNLLNPLPTEQTTGSIHNLLNPMATEEMKQQMNELFYISNSQVIDSKKVKV